MFYKWHNKIQHHTMGWAQSSYNTIVNFNLQLEKNPAFTIKKYAQNLIFIYRPF